MHFLQCGAVTYHVYPRLLDAASYDEIEGCNTSQPAQAVTRNRTPTGGSSLKLDQ
jgi:hypothetical protein